jgi:hypothetical protein
MVLECKVLAKEVLPEVSSFPQSAFPKQKAVLP